MYVYPQAFGLEPFALIQQFLTGIMRARSLGRCKLISNHYKDYGLKNYGLHMYAYICVYIYKIYIILHINHHLFQIFVYIYNIIDTGVYIYIYV